MSAFRLFCFGTGFCARVLARRALAKGWRVAGTTRSEAKRATLEAAGIDAYLFDRGLPLPAEALHGTTHIVASVPPDADGDPVLDAHGRDIAALLDLKWIAYLSTTGVYGDRGGDWVDETSPLEPVTERGARRLAAETAWLGLWRRWGVPVHIFRLAGIYGPGRNQLLTVRDGTAKRIVKPGQVFSRIHVEDVATVLEASIARPNPGAAYNVCDDQPAPPQEVVAFAADRLNLPRPPEIAFEDAELSAMARSFYAESKRVSNARIKNELGVRLAYPSYREGLAALLAEL